MNKLPLSDPPYIYAKSENMMWPITTGVNNLDISNYDVFVDP